MDISNSLAYIVLRGYWNQKNANHGSVQVFIVLKKYGREHKPNSSLSWERGDTRKMPYVTGTGDSFTFRFL
jgi:hypothetical protein